MSLILRKHLQYPPYVRLANVLVWGRDEEQVKKLSHSLYRDISDCISQVDASSWLVFAPTPCVLSRLRGVWRYHLLIKAPLEDATIDEVLEPYFRKRKTQNGVHVAIDIDPISLL